MVPIFITKSVDWLTLSASAVQHERGPRNSTLRRQMALYFKDTETPNMPPLDLALPKVTSSTSSPPRTMPPPHPMQHHPSPPPPPHHHPHFFASPLPKVSRTLFIMTVIVATLVARRCSIIISTTLVASIVFLGAASPVWTCRCLLDRRTIFQARGTLFSSED